MKRNNAKIHFQLTQILKIQRIINSVVKHLNNGEILIIMNFIPTLKPYVKDLPSPQTKKRIKFSRKIYMIVG